MLLAERHESERLRQIIKELQRHRFGRKAETLPEEQMLLGLDPVGRSKSPGYGHLKLPHSIIAVSAAEQR